LDEPVDDLPFASPEGEKTVVSNIETTMAWNRGEEPDSDPMEFDLAGDEPETNELQLTDMLSDEDAAAPLVDDADAIESAGADDVEESVEEFVAESIEEAPVAAAAPADELDVASFLDEPEDQAEAAVDSVDVDSAELDSVEGDDVEAVEAAALNFDAPAEPAAEEEAGEAGDDALGFSIEEEFRPRPEPTPGPALDFSAGASAAPAVAPASLAAKGRPAKKKSSLPMVLVALLLVVLVVGGAGGGLFMMGMIPGFGGGEAPVVVAPPVPGAAPVVDAGAQRINDHVKALTDFVRNASAGGEINGEQLTAAQAYLDKLQAEEPEMLNEEPIKDMQSRLIKLGDDYKQQVKKAQEQKRKEDFNSALELAGANAPAELDEGMLDQARQLAANDGERQLVAALETEHADYVREQEQLAAAAKQKEMQQLRAAALAALPAALKSGAAYQAAAAAAATALGEDPLVQAIADAAQRDGATLDAVQEWNTLLADWTEKDMRSLSPPEAQ
ncbi:MAG: hypothetical protein KDA41_13190, partial [Planctomycetales bacterium]|nr:hypothetical protein [Planctomycetales bacterium]